MLLPDDLVLPGGCAANDGARSASEHGGSVLCAFDIPREEISAYGVFEVTDTDDADVKQVHGMVEKPAADEAPSTFAAAGRYLLDVGDLRRAGPDHPGRGRRAAAHRRRRAADLGGAPGARGRAPRRAATTSATPAATSARSSTTRWSTPSTAPTCAPGSTSGWRAEHPCGRSTSSSSGSWAPRSGRPRCGWRSPRRTACAAPRRSSRPAAAGVRPGRHRRLRRAQRRPVGAERGDAGDAAGRRGDPGRVPAAAAAAARAGGAGGGRCAAADARRRRGARRLHRRGQRPAGGARAACRRPRSCAGSARTSSRATSPCAGTP